MARCGPLAAVLDADDPTWPVRGACVVHRHYAPCPLDGEPACPDPIHGDCRPSAEAGLTAHRYRTLGQRPFVQHMGSLVDLSPSGAQHYAGADLDAAAACWCGPVVFPAEVLA